MADQSDAAAIAALLTAGEAERAVAVAAAAVAADPADPALLRAAALALLAAAATGDAFAGLAAPARDRLVAALVMQEACATRPFILHEELANRLSSPAPVGVAALMAQLAPWLQAWCATTPPKPVLLLLLVARSVLARWPAPADLNRWHLAGFPRFTERDLALPYSALFYPHAFGRNRDELRAALAAGGDGFVGQLAPHHLPLLSWVNGGAVPPDWWPALGQPATDDNDRRAARAWHLAGGSSAAAAGVDAATSAAATTLAEARATLRAAAGPPAPAASRRLGDRRRQALRLAENALARRLPFIARGDRRVRVAVCVSGQLRGAARAWPSWRRHFLGRAEADLFVHSWAAIGRGPAQPWRAVLPFAGQHFTAAYRALATEQGMAAMEARYPALFALLAHGATTDAAALRQLYGTPHVVVDDEADPRFAGWSNQRKMHWKIAAAHRLMAETGRDYDLVVRLRPDLPLRGQGFSWADMAAAAQAGPCLYTDAALGVNHGSPMIGDQLAIGAPATMAVYAATHDRYPALAALDLPAAPAELTGHLSLAQCCWLHGIRVHRAPVRLGGLLDPAPVATAAIRTALDRDAAGRMDAGDRHLLNAAARDPA